jgi:hypothetical protein
MNAEKHRLDENLPSTWRVLPTEKVSIAFTGEMKSVFNNPLNYLLNVVIKTVRLAYS